MKWNIIFFSIIIVLKTYNCESNDTYKNFSKDDLRRTNPVEYWMVDITKNFGSFIYANMEENSENSSLLIDFIYDLIETIDKKCFDFLVDFLLDSTIFAQKLSRRLIHDGGLIQYSLSTEEDCIHEGGFYMIYSGKYDISVLRNKKIPRSDEILFKEAFNWREEVCIFKECKNIYFSFLEYLTSHFPQTIEDLFNGKNIKILGFNYSGLYKEQVDYRKTEQAKKQEESDKLYFCYIEIIFKVMLIFYVLCSIISLFIRKNNRIINSGKSSSSSEKSNEKKYIKKNIKSEEDEVGTLLQKDKTWQDLKWYRILSSFDFINNLSIVNNKKEPLSDQTSLIQLSTIKILILFFILVGENIYILLKYVDNKMSILPLLRNNSFYFIKLGTNSYEVYKVISGVIFGFKFINYYNKIGKFEAKNILRFCTKPFPYILAFLIIHFTFNYPIFIYARKFFGNHRNTYLSNIMCSYECYQNSYNIFNIFSILWTYDSQDFKIGQYNGCTRPILFTFSELICFYIVMIFAVINIRFKNKIMNIIYTIFFCLNFVFLSLTYFLSKEVKDLINEYTISRLFGLSGSLSMPYLFFPLYYIGFNIGIIYYYHLNEISNKLIADNETEKYFPFKYCYNISSFITRIRGITKNIFIIIFIVSIIIVSSIFTFIINRLNDTELLFTFEDIPFSKFLVVYEGIIVGLLFSFFILFYLCESANNFFRSILSSRFFIFVHKISFVWFISFVSFLNFFHTIGLMEVYLMNFSMFANSITLFIITFLISFIFTCLFLFPLKWIYLFIMKGFNNEEKNAIL